MTPRDLAFLKTIQEKVQKYNALHKQIHLFLSDSWNNSKNRYDYLVSIKTSLDPSKPNDKKSIDKATMLASQINKTIFNNGYYSYWVSREMVHIEYIS